MTRIALGSSDSTFEPVEVDLWGRIFMTRQVTRTVQKEIETLQQKLMESEDTDETVGLYGDLVGALTVPTGGQKKTAGAVIREMWDADKLSTGQIVDFTDQLTEAVLEVPPTPTPS